MRQGMGYFYSGFSTPLPKAAPTLGLRFSSACSGFSMGHKAAGMSQSRWDTCHYVSSSRVTNPASKPFLDAPRSPFEISIT
ncbi:hypothetical protein F2Q70_00014487 [Brassica cretica]|uniref:Uncharacterized protein n=1 Tax=Brassica cretica TaxID=69181 RepID=A0A8S9I4G9_BRACR|nr:hypothetical protein F2Q70_00014487 [Brassica cretica]